MKQTIERRVFCRSRSGGTFRCSPLLFATTFAVMFSHICNVAGKGTNGLNHAVRVHPEVYYLQHAHTCTSSITSRIAFLQQTCNSSHLLYATLKIAQMVLPWFIWQSSPPRVSCRAIGFHSVSLEIAHRTAVVVVVRGGGGGTQ